MRVCELKEKKVINICDGAVLGNACDVEFEEKTGKIIAIVVPGPCKIFGILGRDQEYVIPYECITRIGEDTVLVEVEAQKCIRKCEWSEK